MSISNLNEDMDIAAQINIMENDITEQENYIEAKMIIQEFHDDSSVFIVGSAPFGKLWFDQERVDNQYELLCENWAEDYDETTNIRSKKPRIMSVLISEHDPIFDDFRETIRETQAKKNLIHELVMQMKIAEAVRAAMAAIGIVYPIEPTNQLSEPVSEPDTEAVSAIAPVATAPNVVVKGKKTHAKKTATAPATNSGENVVLEKKTYKPRQKKNVVVSDDSTA